MKKRLSVTLIALAVFIGIGSCVRSETAERRQPSALPTENTRTADHPDHALGKRLFASRRPQDVESFRIHTPERAYHFSKDASGNIFLDGSAADAAGFAGMLDLFFALPLQESTSESPETAPEMTLTLGYSDGTAHTLTIDMDQENAWVRLENEKPLRTDTWRIHAVMIACDGARVSE